MLYRVELDLNFSDKADAEALMNYIEGIKDKTYKPKGTEKIECRQSTRCHACTHDEKNPAPCKDYINIDFTQAKKIHKL